MNNIIDIRKKRIKKLEKSIDKADMPSFAMPGRYLGVWLYGCHMPYSMNLDDIKEALNNEFDSME